MASADDEPDGVSSHHGDGPGAGSAGGEQDPTPEAGGPDEGVQDPPRYGGDGAEAPAPDSTGTPQDALDDPDVDPVDGFHEFRGLAVPVSGPDEHGIVVLRCSHVARMSPGERATLERTDVWPPLQSCGTCTPHVPNGVPDSWP